MNDAAARFRASLEARIANFQPDNSSVSSQLMPSRGTWPWPWHQLSNGFQIELNEVLQVRCLRDFDGSEGAVARAGDKIAIRAEPRSLELVKFGRGNRRFLSVMANPVEGRDFEVIPGEKMWLANEQARLMSGLSAEEAAERAEREIGENTDI